MIYIVAEILNHWFTTTLIVVNVGIWIALNHFNVPVQKVSFNYKLIVEDKEWYRIVTSTFSHYNFLHILFNMFSLWSYRFMEYPLYGVIGYLKISWIIMIVSSVFTLIIYKLLMWRMNWQHYRNDVHAVGYSAVIFGLLTVGALFNPRASFDLLFGLKLPVWVTPIFYLVVSSLLFPQASFVGHLSGILAGLLIHFYVFIWMVDIVFYILFPIFVIIMLYTSKIHQKFEPVNRVVVVIENQVRRLLSYTPLARFQSLPLVGNSSVSSTNNSNLTVVNGVLVPRGRANADDTRIDIPNQGHVLGTAASTTQYSINTFPDMNPHHIQVDLPPQDEDQIDQELYGYGNDNVPKSNITIIPTTTTTTTTSTPLLYTQDLSHQEDDFDLNYTSSDDTDNQRLLPNSK
jgi:membrane associated rhomboid family serine protease